MNSNKLLKLAQIVVAITCILAGAGCTAAGGLFYASGKKLDEEVKNGSIKES